MGYVIPSKVFDGRKELPRLFPDKKLQPCQFLLQKTVHKYLTKHLKTEVDIALKETMDTLTKTDKESFIGMLGKWCQKWADGLAYSCKMLAFSYMPLHM